MVGTSNNYSKFLQLVSSFYLTEKNMQPFGGARLNSSNKNIVGIVSILYSREINFNYFIKNQLKIKMIENCISYAAIFFHLAACLKL